MILIMEVASLQSLFDPIILVYGMAPIIIGVIFGYVLGAMKSIETISRAIMAILIGGIIGIIFVVSFTSLIAATPIALMLAIIASIGGILLGMAWNWTPTVPKGRLHHIIYEPDDDDAFDREIDEALSGSRK